jgi:molecular chaperone DnaJ
LGVAFYGCEPTFERTVTKRDYYEILGVERSCGDDELKRAYRQQAKKFHPDLNQHSPEAEDKFKEAAEAYEVLRDPDKRRIYDQFGHAGLEGRGYHGFSGVEDVFSSFGDIFDTFFGFGGGGGRRSRTGPAQGSDLETRLRISFREALFGTQRQIDVERETHCTDCAGTGAEAGSEPQVCAQCGGRGQVAHAQGFFSIATTCPRCRGTGRFIAKPCKICRGAGRKIERKKVEVEIPPGVDERVRIRLAGEGEGGFRHGPPGDLYVGLAIEKDPHFRREGENLFSTQAISITQAALGATIQVETVHGNREVHVPKGTQTGDVLTLEGLGAPKLRKNSNGNHFLEIKVTIPKRLTKKQEELLREFAHEAGEGVDPPQEGILDRLKKKKK